LNLVVDTSAIMAVALREPERAAYLEILRRAEPAMSMASLVECYLVLQARRGATAILELDILVDTLAIHLEPVLAEDRAILRDAVRDFARGRRQPPAVLNFGDLFAYALAKRLGLPLLFKGQDFAATDVDVVPLSN
jgi:ribonuclease VapC